MFKSQLTAEEYRDAMANAAFHLRHHSAQVQITPT